jgi:predicted TIM-barrel fold metal-dependent hydrolase
MSVDSPRPCEPPRPPSKPRKVAPRGATDCHFHMFGSPDRYAISPGRSYTPPPEANIDSYLAMAETLGLERMVIVHPTPYGADHSCTRDAIGIFGLHRAKAVAVIDESFSKATLQAMDQAGFCAARINSVTPNGTPLSQLKSVAKLIAPLGWHLEIYTQPEAWPELAESLLALPVPVVIDHMGRIPTKDGMENLPFQTLLRLLGSGKCWVKLCGYRCSTGGPPYADLLAPAQRMIEAAPERCVWGTDWPHPGMAGELLPDDGKLLDLLYDWAPDARQLQRILVDNPAQLYGFASSI